MQTSQDEFYNMLLTGKELRDIYRARYRKDHKRQWWLAQVPFLAVLIGALGLLYLSMVMTLSASLLWAAVLGLYLVAFMPGWFYKRSQEKAVDYILWQQFRIKTEG